MRLTLTKQQALVAKAAAREGETPRRELGFVRIGDGHVVATDGFGMASAPVEYDGETVFIPAHMLPSGPCDVDMDGESVSVITKDGTQETAHEVVKYPDAEKAWAKMTKRPPKAHIALSAALLRRMLACVEGKDGWKNPNGIVRLYVRRPSDPLEWRVQDAEGNVLVQGLVMPMFVDWREDGKGT